jgi:hypothetical protein
MSGQNSKTRTRAWRPILPDTGGGGITQLTGPVTAGPGVGAQATTITPTGVAPGTYGDATNVAQVTVNAAGQVTAAADVPIAFPAAPSPLGTVTNVAPGTAVGVLPNARAQTLVMDTSGAQSSFTMPAAPVDKDIVRVSFIGAANPNGQKFTANAGQTLGDPNTPGTFTAVAGNTVVFTPGANIAWFWQAANTRWVEFQ